MPRAAVRLRRRDLPVWQLQIAPQKDSIT